MKLSKNPILKCEFNNFKPNNMVVLFEWDTPFNLYDSFTSIPIVKGDGEAIIKGKKIKIPYFGVEGIIVNIRYKKKSRGVRPKTTRSDNFVSVDFQIDQRNVHIKLSNYNALVMGVDSYDTALNAMNSFLKIIEMTNNNNNYLRSSLEKIPRLNSLIENMFTDLPDCKDFINECVKHNIDVKLGLICLSHAYEANSYTDYETSLRNIIDCNLIKQINIRKSSVSNSGFNYRLNYSEGEFKSDYNFVLNTLAVNINNINPTDIKITDENGEPVIVDMIIASHHNWYSKYVNVVIRIISEGGESLHRFNISEGGSIRQWSPSMITDSYTVYCLFVDIINHIINSDPNVYSNI